MQFGEVVVSGQSVGVIAPDAEVVMLWKKGVANRIIGNIVYGCLLIIFCCFLMVGGESSVGFWWWVFESLLKKFLPCVV